MHVSEGMCVKESRGKFIRNRSELAEGTGRKEKGGKLKGKKYNKKLEDNQQQRTWVLLTGSNG